MFLGGDVEFAPGRVGMCRDLIGVWRAAQLDWQDCVG